MKEQDIESCLTTGMNSAREKLLLPRNLTKGDYPRNFRQLLKLLTQELGELSDAVVMSSKTVEDVRGIRSEAGDVIAFASMIVQYADECIEAQNDRG